MGCFLSGVTHPMLTPRQGQIGLAGSLLTPQIESQGHWPSGWAGGGGVRVVAGYGTWCSA